MTVTQNTTDAPAEGFVGPIEVVLVVCGGAESGLMKTAGRSAERLRGILADALPAFDWRLTVRLLPRPEGDTSLEPADLIGDPAVAEAAEAGDFTLVVTDRDLVARYQAVALGAPSRAAASAVASTSRLGTERVEARLTALCLHLLGRLNGLGPAADSRS
ncbi:MAG: hypothetical protein WD341_19880 [Tistlia sp.]|uniref:hypothetical protein n=1 Tax=Tistlia sp. TaxID=3057121 RepID=UPI0034A3E262